ncbi:MAG: hypothetical protein JW763_05625 [candidate division Zixibacteria bacterium]|nr:hypothetical protein [candidate division Zixibacteria bacterium]
MRSVVEILTQWLIKPPKKLPISIKCNDIVVAQSVNDLFRAQKILAEIIPVNEKPRYKVYTEIEIPPFHERLMDLSLVIEYVLSLSRYDNTPDIYIELSKFHLALFFFLCHKYTSAAGLNTPIYNLDKLIEALYRFTKHQHFRYPPNSLIRLGDSWSCILNGKAAALEILKLLGMSSESHYIENEFFMNLSDDYYIEDSEVIEVVKRRQHGTLPEYIKNPEFSSGPYVMTSSLSVISGDFRHFLHPNRPCSEWLKEFKNRNLLQQWVDHTFELKRLQDESIHLFSLAPFNSIINQDEIKNLKPINDIYDRSVKAKADLLNLTYPKQDVNSGELTWFYHTPDYRCVKKGDQEFTLTPRQAHVIQILHDSHMSGTPDISKDYIINEVAGSESNYKKLSELFRDKDAYKALITSGKRKGTYRLNIPQE